jgi:hypothetical protein
MPISKANTDESPMRVRSARGRTGDLCLTPIIGRQGQISRPCRFRHSPANVGPSSGCFARNYPPGRA